MQQKIQELQPQAIFTHCHSHALNLVVVHGCSDVPIVRNTMTMIEKIAVLFSASATKKKMLQDHIFQEQRSEGTRGGILLMSIRWRSRIKTVAAFLSKPGPVDTALQEIECEGTQQNSEKATRLWNNTESFDTVVTA